MSPAESTTTRSTRTRSHPRRSSSRRPRPGHCSCRRCRRAGWRWRRRRICRSTRRCPAVAALRSTRSHLDTKAGWRTAAGNITRMQLSRCSLQCPLLLRTRRSRVSCAAPAATRARAGAAASSRARRRCFSTRLGCRCPRTFGGTTCCSMSRARRRTASSQVCNVATHTAHQPAAHKIKRMVWEGNSFWQHVFCNPGDSIYSIAWLALGNSSAALTQWEAAFNHMDCGHFCLFRERLTGLTTDLCRPSCDLCRPKSNALQV